MDKIQQVLAVFPHPDDETFGKAGTISLYTRSGTRVTLICATLGQMGRNMGKPFFATRETLPLLRKRELMVACEILGIQDVRILNLRDKTLEFEDPRILAAQIRAVIQEIRPSVVMTYYPGHGVHPDHDALSSATLLAIGEMPADKRPVLWGAALTPDAHAVLGPPDIVIDVREIIDTVIEALKAHRSQTEAMLAETQIKAGDTEDFRRQMMDTFGHESYWSYTF